MEETFLDILKELEYRSGEIIDLKSSKQIAILSEILNETQFIHVKDELLSALLEKGEAPRKPEEKERDEKEDDKYMHTSNNVYIKKQDQKKYDNNQDDAAIDRFKKDDQGTYKKISSADAGLDKTGDDTSKTDSGASDEEDAADLEAKENQENIAKTFADKEYQEKIKDEKEAYENDKNDVSTVEAPSVATLKLIKKDIAITDSQLYMTKRKARNQAKAKKAKNVGAGTPESRAGEAMVHKGIRLLQQGKTLEEVQQEFAELVSSRDHILNTTSGKQWVSATTSTLKKLDETIGIDNIRFVSWDTKQGRKALGITESLETSSDMFVKTKDGKNLGISLKKDGLVFLNNGGWEKQSKIILDDLKEGGMDKGSHAELTDAMSIDTYKEDITTRFQKTAEDLGIDEITKSVEKLMKAPPRVRNAYFSGNDGEKWLEILRNPKKLVKNIELDNTTTNEKKAYAKLLQTYHTDEYNHIRESDAALTKRTMDAISNSESAKKGMKEYIIKAMHLMDTLSLDSTLQDNGVDNFMTMYGIPPNGAALNEHTLITLLGSKFKSALDEVKAGKKPKEELMDMVTKSINIDYDSGTINFMHENNNQYPLFVMNGRTKALGSAPTMQLIQTPFMAHALKQGTFDTNDWDKASVSRFKKDINKIDDTDD